MLTYYTRGLFTFFSLACLLCGYTWFEKKFMLSLLLAIAANRINAADSVIHWQKVIRIFNDEVYITKVNYYDYVCTNISNQISSVFITRPSLVPSSSGTLVATKRKVFEDNDALQNTHSSLIKTRLTSKFDYIHDTKGIKIEVKSNSGNVIGKYHYDNKLSACATFKENLCFYIATNHNYWTNGSSFFSENKSLGSILTNSIQQEEFRKNTTEVFTFNYYSTAHYSATLHNERLQFLTQESYRS